MSTFIFFDVQPFSQRNYHRFNIQKIKKNFKVEYWNCSKIINANIENTRFKKYRGVKVINFRNYYELVKYSLKINYKNSFYVDYVNGLKFSIIKRFLQKKKFKRLVINEKFPSIGLSIKDKTGIYFKFRTLIILLKMKLIIFFENIIASEIHLASNYESKHSIKPRKVIKNHNLDYNLYLKYKNHRSKNNYIVFLDQGHPQPWDRQLRGGKPFLRRKNYWINLNKILLQIQKKFKKEIIICEHPRNKILKSETKCKIIRNNTYKVIKDSKLVISHFSLALQQAILLKKKILLLEFDGYPVEMKKKINFFCKKLDVSKINVSKNLKDLPKIKFNEKKYNNFSENFIFEKSHCNKNSWDYLLNEINFN